MIPNRHWLLLLTRFSKKGIMTWLTKKGNQKTVEESITPPISEKNKIDTFKKKEKSQASNKSVDTPKINKTDTDKSLDKLMFTQRNDTEKW